MQRQEQYIEFGVGEHHFAVKIDEVREIIKMQPITHIPHSRPDVKGVFDLRGSVVPVIGLRALFGLDDETDTKSTRIVVVACREQPVGLIVDRVTKVTTYADIQPPPETGRPGGRLLAGIGMREGRLAQILRLDEVVYPAPAPH